MKKLIGMSIFLISGVFGLDESITQQKQLAIQEEEKYPNFIPHYSRETKGEPCSRFFLVKESVEEHVAHLKKLFCQKDEVHSERGVLQEREDRILHALNYFWTHGRGFPKSEKSLKDIRDVFGDFDYSPEQAGEIWYSYIVLTKNDQAGLIGGIMTQSTAVLKIFGPEILRGRECKSY